MKKIALKEDYKPGISRTQFKSTHPEWGPRIAQLEQIKYDIDKGNLKIKKGPLNWVQMSRSYLDDLRT